MGRAKGKVLLDGYLNEQEEADELGVTPQTLRKWRRLGEGPPYTEFARQFMYSIAGTVAWLKAREVKPVRSARAA
jgi:hypothetical protein